MKSAVFLLQSFLCVISFGTELDLKQREKNESRRQTTANEFWNMAKLKRSFSKQNRELRSIFPPSKINSSDKGISLSSRFVHSNSEKVSSNSVGLFDSPKRVFNNSSYDEFGDIMTDDSSISNIFVNDLGYEQISACDNILLSNNISEDQIKFDEASGISPYETPQVISDSDYAIHDFGGEQKSMLAMVLPSEINDNGNRHKKTIMSTVGYNQISDNGNNKISKSSKSGLYPSEPYKGLKPDFEPVSESPIVNDFMEETINNPDIPTRDSALISDDTSTISFIEKSEKALHIEVTTLREDYEQMFLSKHVTTTLKVNDYQNLAGEVPSSRSMSISESNVPASSSVKPTDENVTKVNMVALKADENIKVSHETISTSPINGQDSKMTDISTTYHIMPPSNKIYSDKTNNSLLFQKSDPSYVLKLTKAPYINTTEKILLNNEQFSLPHDVRIVLDVAIKPPNDTFVNDTDRKALNKTVIPGIGTMAFGLKILSSSANSSQYPKPNEPVDTTLDLSSMKIMRNQQNYTIPAKGILDPSDKHYSSKNSLFFPIKMNEFEATTCSSLYITRNKTSNIDLAPNTTMLTSEDKQNHTKVILLLPLEVGQLFNLSSCSRSNVSEKKPHSSSFSPNRDITPNKDKKHPSSKMLLRLKMKDYVSKADENFRGASQKFANKIQKNDSMSRLVRLPSGQVVNLATAKALLKLKFKDFMTMTNNSSSRYSVLEPEGKFNDSSALNKTTMALLRNGYPKRTGSSSHTFGYNGYTSKPYEPVNFSSANIKNRTLKDKFYSGSDDSVYNASILLMNIINMMKNDPKSSRNNLVLDNCIFPNDSYSAVLSEVITKRKLRSDKVNNKIPCLVTFMKSSKPKLNSSQTNETTYTSINDKLGEDLINMFKRPFIENLNNKSISSISLEKEEIQTYPVHATTISTISATTISYIPYVVANKIIESPGHSLVKLLDAERNENTELPLELTTETEKIYETDKLNKFNDKIVVIQLIQLTPNLTTQNITSAIHKVLLNSSNRHIIGCSSDSFCTTKTNSTNIKQSDKSLKIMPSAVKYVIDLNTSIDNPTHSYDTQPNDDTKRKIKSCGVIFSPEEASSLRNCSESTKYESSIIRDIMDSFKERDMSEEQLYSDRIGGGISQRMAISGSIHGALGDDG